MRVPNPSNMGAYLLLAQGLYYLAAGVWPLVSIRTFQRVTGPKTDLWLVKTVGVLVAVIGGVLIVAGWRSPLALEALLLAVGSALALTGIEVVYVAKGRIATIYLWDALAELALVVGWIVVGTRGGVLERLGWVLE